METEKHHIVPYRVYVYILIALVVMTFMSIGITKINLGAYSVLGAMIFATVKSVLVLTWFMHLKFDQPLLRFMVGFVVLLFFAVIFITFLDYYFR
ncbi:MAG: cytochrome C oxidase subunit IV family protein [Bacteroidota bacterium]|nr:cytochrome C oxidase subunit IV family protein [Bacteroidota bacterium]MDP3915371.1 cytochrome C oxidase subunit IV family protein [Bacteroidota bacterium]